MTYILRSCRIAFCIVSIIPCINAVKTVFIPRSQGHAPSMVCMPAYQHTFITTLNYAQSYKSSHIAEDLFGSSTLHISGSQVPNRSAQDLLADNFGLAPDFESTIHFKPQIESIIFACYVNMPLDKILSGLYVNIMLPVTYSRWALNPCETVTNRGMLFFPNGYMGNAPLSSTAPTIAENDGTHTSCCTTITPAPSPYAPAQTAASAQSYFQGNVITGDILRPLSYNKISWCPLKRTELAELIVRLGRNLICNDYTFASVFLRASFQTGNKPRPEYLFSPICGNGNFFELGLGTQGQHQFTRDDNQTRVIFLWDISAEHLFQTKQVRTFDLLDGDGCNKNPLSRYLLLKNINGTNLSYNGELLEASYFTTFPVVVSRTLQGDVDLKLSIEHKGFTQNFGYALWGTTAETIKPEWSQPLCPAAGNLYGIKGTTGAYNYITAITTVTALQPLNATESNSTAYQAGTIDNPVALPYTTPYNNVSGTTIIDPSLLARASQPPSILECVNIDRDSARSPGQLTHAFFMETGYTMTFLATQPALLVGASVEIASHKPSELHQWSIWIKGNVSW